MATIPLKTRIKGSLQVWLGYERFLYLFARFKARTLQWDRREAGFRYFLRQLPEDGVVLDIGANLGFLCLHLARRVARGRVLAFEPLPDNLRTLHRIVRGVGVENVDVYPWAVGDHNGSVSMVLPLQGRAREQGLGHVVDTAEMPETGLEFEVPIRRLDDLPEVNNPGTRIAGLKIDVEDFERFVLEGARAILERDRPLVYLELWNDENQQVCLAIARELGYRVMVFEGRGLIPFEPVKHRHHGNFFFVPQATDIRLYDRFAEPSAAGRSSDHGHS